MPRWVGCLCVVMCIAGSSTIGAQWLNQRTPNSPRLPDGTLNLKAPAPRLPDGRVDFSGLWQRVLPGVEANEASNAAFGRGLAFRFVPAEGGDVPMRPAAQQIYAERRRGNGRDRPTARCLPHGIPYGLLVPVPFKIVHAGSETLMLFEALTLFREVFTDGRSLPTGVEPTWPGYSVGRWERDELVVESRGYSEKSWLDSSGLPRSTELRLTERYRRVEYGHLEVTFTIDDPVMYTRTWTTPPALMELLPDSDLIEHICENEKSYQHFVAP